MLLFIYHVRRQSLRRIAEEYLNLQMSDGFKEVYIWVMVE